MMLSQILNESLQAPSVGVSPELRAATSPAKYDPLEFQRWLWQSKLGRDPNEIQPGVYHPELNQFMEPNVVQNYLNEYQHQMAQPVFVPSAWATAHGLAAQEEAASKGQNPGWDSQVSSIQDQEAPKSGLEAFFSNPANLLFAATTGQTGGMTGAQALTGGDVRQGAATDLAGLAAGAGLSQALPSLGLSSVAPTAASDAPLQSLLTNVADTVIASGGPMPAGVTPGIGVDAINAAAPGAITKGLSDAELMSLGLGAGAAGGAVAATPVAAPPPSPTLTPGQQALAAGGATAVGAEAVNPSSDPNTNFNTGPADTTTAQTTDPNAPGATADGVPNTVTNAVAGAAGSIGGTKLSDILSGNVNPLDWASTLTVGDLSKVAGGVLPAAIGAYASNQQANKLSDLAQQYIGFGAPSRARYEASFQPGFNATDIPGFNDALNASTDALLRRASMGGNPTGNPGVLADISKYTTANVALPAIQNYQNQNAATGGYGAFNTAAPGAAAGAVNAGTGVYNAIGAGAADVLNPPKTLADLLRDARNAGY